MNRSRLSLFPLLLVFAACATGLSGRYDVQTVDGTNARGTCGSFRAHVLQHTLSPQQSCETGLDVDQTGRSALKST